MLGECSSGQPSLWRIVAKTKLLIRSIVLCHGMPKCKYVYATQLSIVLYFLLLPLYVQSYGHPVHKQLVTNFFSLNTKCNGDLDENVEFSLSYFNNDIYV